MSGRVGAELWDRWIELWNGDLGLVEEIVDPGFELHRIPPPMLPDHLRGREALRAWVEQNKERIPIE